MIMDHFQSRTIVYEFVDKTLESKYMAFESCLLGNLLFVGMELAIDDLGRQ